MFSKKITSLHNPLIKHLVKLREDRRYRREQQTVLVTGAKLVKELEKVHPPKRIFTTEGYSLAVLRKITGLASPDGVAAEFILPQASLLIGKAPLLVLDRITDPGNMGTLLRTALALGWGGVFFLPGCVDPFHEKVVRSSEGALFSLPWKEGEWDELKKFRLKIYTADTEGTPISQISFSKQTMLILSNEAKGVSDNGAQLGKRITIPMSDKVESLNVAIAGGILMYVIGGSI